MSSSKRAAFRAVLSGSTAVVAGSVWDPISARIADKLGVRVGLMGGSLGSYAVLGAPDIIVLTLTEFADQARRACRASKVSLLVDADHGYGNALNVMRTVEELENAGVAGLSIEDTLLPQPFGSGGKSALISVEEGVGKVRAALAARSDKSLVISGRTSAVGITGVADAIARAKAYEAAGADAMFFVGVKTAEELDALCGSVRIPIILGGVPAKLMDRAALAAKGARICLQGHQPFQASIAALHATMKALRDGVAPAALTGLASNELSKRVTRDDAYAQAIRDYLET